MAWKNYGNRQSKPAYVKPAPVAPVKPTQTPSEYQQAILDFVRTGTGSVVIEAVAGSGKTSTLAMLDWQLNEMGATRILVAFNASIAQALRDRGLNGRTFNSVGNGTVQKYLYSQTRQSRTPVEGRKVPNIIEEMFGRDSAGYASALTRLVSLAKAHVMRPESMSLNDIANLIGHFGIEWDDDNISDERMFEMVRSVLRANNELLATIDFDDQIYFVELFNLRVEQFDFVLVDESQDTNPLRRALVARMMSPTSRLIAVGDSRQAIYGFAGASHDSMALIQRQFNAVSLPLSICYRCPASVVSLAQTIVPTIQARPDAPAGEVLYPRVWKRADFVATDLLLCRNTAPLVATAYKMLSARIPCKIMGREIGQGLVNLIRKLSRKNETLETLVDRLTDYCAAEVARALAQKKESKAQSVQDKVDSILALIDSLTPEDVDQGINGLCAAIESMFSDNGANVTTLATVHKAKGLEAPRVFILDPDLMPSKMARQEWQVIQEHNLRYVAITRALETLVFVDTKTLGD